MTSGYYQNMLGLTYFVSGKEVGLQDELCHRNLPPCKRLLLSNSSRIALKMFRCLKFQLPLLLLPTHTSIIRFAYLFFTAYTGVILCNVTSLAYSSKFKEYGNSHPDFNLTQSKHQFGIGRLLNLTLLSVDENVVGKPCPSWVMF